MPAHALREEPDAPAPAPRPVPFVIETVSPAEQLVSFRVGDSWCRLRSLELRSGVRLGLTGCQYEPGFAFGALQPPAELELTVSRGGVLQALTADGRELAYGGNTLQLGHLSRPQPMLIQPQSQERTETVSLAFSAARLRELLGATELPVGFREVLDSRAPHTLRSQAVPARVFRIFDELLAADVKGPARTLWYEARSLELLAVMCDELVETARASTDRLSAYDIERLHVARARLVADLAAPPTLTQLARTAGLSETRLKAGFQTLFGAPVFSYLRQERLEAARRLLVERRLNVTEVALRVGYANPGKFAAAFRRQFGASPSAVAASTDTTTLPRL